MQKTIPLLLLSALIAPAAVAATPGPAAQPWLGGELDIHASYLYGIVPCRETAFGTIHDLGGEASVPEHRRLELQVPDSLCGARTLVFDAHLDENGWRLGDGETIRGTLTPAEDGLWWLHLVASTCPPHMICLGTPADIRYTGLLGPIYTTQ